MPETNKWAKPKDDVTYLDTVFGPGNNMADFLPDEAEIPKEFWNGHTVWNEVTSIWFFEGLKGGVLNAKDGINQTAALAHLASILKSFEPKHEHKEAGVAYLMSLWFKKPNPANSSPTKEKTP